MAEQGRFTHTASMLKNILISRFSPFKHKNFTLFFLVQTISSIGKWSHDLARAWIVIEMLGRAGALGGLLFASSIPPLFLILQGGVLVDRIDVQKLMTLTKALLAVASLCLAFLYEFSEVQFWQLLIFAVIEGCIMAFDSPAFQALTVRLVPREDFQQALALNSVNFHLGRALGPLVAGLLMAGFGPGAVFLFDGLSYLLLVVVLSQLDLKKATKKSKQVAENSFHSLVAGLRYAFNTPALRYKLCQLFMAISILFPIQIVIFRTYIASRFGLSNEEFGMVFALPALGSGIGSISFAILKPKRPLRALAIGIPGATLGTMGVALAPTIEIAGLLMALNGLFIYLGFVSLTVGVHLELDDEFRGRVSSLVGMGFLSIGPLMSFPLGIIADIWGYPKFIISGALFYFVMSISIFLLHWKKWEQPHAFTAE